MNIILETQLAWHWKNNNQIKVWAHTTSLSPPFFIEISVRRHVIIKRPCICLLGVSNLPLSMIFILNFRNVPKMWYFLFLILFHQSLQHILFLQQPITSTYPVSPTTNHFNISCFFNNQSLQHILFLQQPITSTYPVSPTFN
jgi:hypothetical protein